MVLNVMRLRARGVGVGCAEGVGHLGVLIEVGEERPSVLLCKAQVGVADELRPAEAVGAVGMARLAGRGEEEHGLRVLVPACSGAVESATLGQHQGATTPLSGNYTAAEAVLLSGPAARPEQAGGPLARWASARAESTEHGPSYGSVRACCTPVSSSFLGALRAFCPAG